MKKRHFDLERLAVALALLILIIFGVDYLRRCIVGLFVKQPELNITKDPTSVSDSADSGTASGEDTVSSGTESEDDTLKPNMGYDTENYITISKTRADIGVGPLILVNQDNAYAGNATASLTSFKDLKNDCYRLRNFDLVSRPEVIDALNAMFQDFAANTGLKNVVIYSTTINDSASIYSTPLAERPAGYSVDFTILGDDGSISTFSGEGNYSWISKNASQYGFIRRFPADKESETGIDAQPWHYRYVGAPHAVLMEQNGYCLEEYIDYISEFRVGGAHASVSVGSAYYEIYYVPASDNENISVPVPKNADYTVSGNNVDGFIVTMELEIT